MKFIQYPFSNCHCELAKQSHQHNPSGVVRVAVASQARNDNCLITFLNRFSSQMAFFLRACFVAASLLALGPAQAQVSITSPDPQVSPLVIRIDDSVRPHWFKNGPVYYLDGEQLDTAAIPQLNPDDITSIAVLRDEAAEHVAKGLKPTEAARGVLFITTKAGERKRRVRRLQQLKK